MRGMRVKKLKAIFKSLVDKQLVHNSGLKAKFRMFKKLYVRGELDKVFPSM